jgi:hypothetical protein
MGLAVEAAFIALICVDTGTEHVSIFGRGSVNATDLSCLLHSVQRKQFLCQTPFSALICSI